MLPEYPRLNKNKTFCHFQIKDYYSSSDSFVESDINKELKILLVRPSSLGDVLLITPILKAIKNKFKKSQITVMTMYKDLFVNNPYCNKIVPVSNKVDYRIYDRIYFLSYEFTQSLSIVDSYANIVGVVVEDHKPEFYLTDIEIINIKKILYKLTGSEKIIGVHKECGWISKRWSDKNWNILVSKLKNKYSDYKIVSFGVDAKSVVEGTMGIVGYKIREVASILKYCKMLICIDSGIMHLGISVGIPVISLFGITDPLRIIPKEYIRFSIQHNGITANIHHQRTVPAAMDLIGTERIKSSLDMDLITPDMVLDKINKEVEI